MKQVINWKNTKPKQRLKGDFKKNMTLVVHPDALEVREKITKKFDGQYIKKEIDTFVYLAFDKLIESNNIKKGDDIEVFFGL